MTDFPLITTKRLCIRELTLDDVESVFGHFSHPDVIKFVDIEVCTDRSEAEKIIAFHINDSLCRHGLFSKDNNELIGTCGFHCWTTDKDGSRAEIGFDLSPNYWQRIDARSDNEIIPIGI